MAKGREMLLKFLHFFCLQQPTAKNNTLSLLEVEQQQHNHTEQNHAEVPQANGPVTFKGIEFLQRDPGLRPQIWQYPPDQ
jgi:hypothetical protein